jgi:hypothetical protein
MATPTKPRGPATTAAVADRLQTTARACPAPVGRSGSTGLSLDPQDGRAGDLDFV